MPAGFSWSSRVRWQARLSTPGASPSLGTVQLTHAPVSFAPSGSATSGPIAAASGRAVTAWTSLVVNASLFSPGGAGASQYALEGYWSLQTLKTPRYVILRLSLGM